MYDVTVLCDNSKRCCLIGVSPYVAFFDSIDLLSENDMRGVDVLLILRGVFGDSCVSSRAVAVLASCSSSIV